MINLKSIFLSAILFISMIFVGCSNGQVKTADILSIEEYNEKLKSITNTIFEEDNYKNKDEVEAFTNDMNLKAKEDNESNQWYYSDQVYLLTVQKMYLDLYNKLYDIDCSDEVTVSIHKSIILQLEDLKEVTSILLQEYSTNKDPKSLNTSIPKIKLIFTDNPNDYTVSELVRNEVNGRIKRINSSIEGLIGIKVKDISKEALNSSDDTNYTEKETKIVEKSEDSIEKARKLVLQATEESETDVIIEYLSNPGSYVDSNKYYVFSMSARDGSYVSDVDYLVDKNTFEVYTYSPYGDIQKISYNENIENKSSNASSNTSTNSNQIPGGISCEKALKNITQGYPDYKYTGNPNGEISYEMYNTAEGIEEPSYIFGFINTQTGDSYVGIVYGDGDYMMKMIFE